MNGTHQKSSFPYKRMVFHGEPKPFIYSEVDLHCPPVVGVPLLLEVPQPFPKWVSRCIEETRGYWLLLFFSFFFWGWGNHIDYEEKIEHFGVRWWKKSWNKEEMALESSDWDILDETCLSLFDFVWLCWGISINMLTCFFWFVWLFVLSPKRCFLRRISGWNFRLYLIFSVAIESMGHAHPEQLHLKFGARFLSYESFAQNMTIQYHRSCLFFEDWW